MRTPSSTITSARKLLQLNQEDFAKKLGKTQSVLSRYESGLVKPPSDIVMHCMHILNISDSEENSDSVDEIIHKIRALSDDKHTKLREALNIFLDSLLKQ